jgi:leucyl-tRNA synthetase
LGVKYIPLKIESKWQKLWEEKGLFRTSMDLQELKQRPKYYALDMFPYPSGAGLHVGHPEGYTATDVVSRYKRMKGFNVLHAMGWDAFGLPAERAAMREGIHPAIITKRNIQNFKAQIKRLGFFYDWAREIDTSEEKYYRWTQWIFLKLYERDLAYLADVEVNWCPALKTVLANEEVKDGRYVETQDLVEKRLMRQWVLKITDYAERLLVDLDELDWPENVKDMQRHWIGKSLGAILAFKLADSNDEIQVFTTRPDTIFGTTFLVLAPEHTALKKIVSEDQKDAVQKYTDQSSKQSAISRADANKEKTGVFTGAYALHPITKAKVPIWVADYVLINYGMGAIMGVPGHDERDKDFAKTHQLQEKEVVVATNGASLAHIEHDGEDTRLINSDFLNDLNVPKAITKAIEHAEKNNYGHGKVQYRLRDWLFSRQRYWGEPFPIVYDAKGQPHPLDASELPVSLPAIDEYKPTDDGQPPLARASDSWRLVKMKDGLGKREVNTMPQWAGSCWYYLRYMDPDNSNLPFDPDLEKYWMPVDLYIGGVEHAVLHLLYARFWHKVLYDCGLVHNKEPFQKLFNQGMILAASFQDDSGKYYYPSEVYEKNGSYYSLLGDKPLKTQVEKMSKSRLNVVNPDEVIDQYGADAMRLYELFMGPLEQVKPWQMTGVEGVYRFLHRVWRLAIDEESDQVSSKVDRSDAPENADLWRELHRTIKKVSEDIENLRFNTAIAQMMTWVNEATGKERISRHSLEIFLQLLSPFAPHIADELSERLGLSGYLLEKKWPEFDASLLKDKIIDLVIQVNGKRRANLSIDKGTPKEAVEALVLEHPEVKRFVGDNEIARVVVIPDRLANVVTK